MTDDGSHDRGWLWEGSVKGFQDPQLTRLKFMKNIPCNYQNAFRVTENLNTCKIIKIPMVVIFPQKF